MTPRALVHSTSGTVISSSAVSVVQTSPAVSVVWRDGDAFVACWRNVVGVRWVGVPQAAQLEALARAHELASAHRHVTDGGSAHGSGDEARSVVLVNDVLRLDGSTKVEAQVHRAMLSLIARCRGRTSAVAHVIEVPGAPGAAVRAFLVALEALSGRGSTRTATFSGPELASRWLAGFAKETPSALLEAWRAMSVDEARRAA